MVCLRESGMKGKPMAEGPSSGPRLGAQLWLERDASSDNVENLVARAAESGLSLLRVFLMWPWIEPEPDAWDFRLFDVAFSAAERHGIGVKATLTTNSGPWHIGTPLALHSHTLTLDEKQRPAIERYVEMCVRRYADHGALDQWVIWNEPFYLVPELGQPGDRTAAERVAWHDLLERRYGENIQALNQRWRTGYGDFSEAEFPEDIPHPRHRTIAWLSYGPWLDEYHHRSEQIRIELQWVADLVRKHDPRTPTCTNPPNILRNHAAAGYDFRSLAEVVDVLGASFHPPWSFSFAPEPRYPAMMAAATSFLAQIPGARRVEVTETQLGNVYYASPNPRHATAADVASYFLAPLFAGAESVTGWCLNTRQQDFEAGDWGLLDDDDLPSERSRIVARAAACLIDLENSIGSWRPVPPRALVLTSAESQAVQMVDGRVSSPWIAVDIPGRREDDAVHGSFLLAAALSAAGVPASPCPSEALADPSENIPGLIVASHLVAYSEAFGRRLLECVHAGAVLLVDGTSGHKTPEALLHRPWPGVLARDLGFRSRGLVTRREGFPVTLYGAGVGQLALVLSDLEFIDPAWSAWEDVRVGDDTAPLIWERSFGRGRALVFAGSLGPSLVADPRLDALVRHVVRSSVPHLVDEARPLSPDAMVLPVQGATGTALGVFAPDRVGRLGQPIRLKLAPGRYRDLWNGGVVDATGQGEAVIDPPDGIAVLV